MGVRPRPLVIAVTAARAGDSPMPRGVLAKPVDQSHLLGRLDGVLAVVVANPGDRIRRGVVAEDGEAGQNCAGAAVAADAADLHSLARPCPVLHALQSGDHVGLVGGYAQVRPVEVTVWPRWLPSPVEIEPVIVVPAVRIEWIE